MPFLKVFMLVFPKIINNGFNICLSFTSVNDLYIVIPLLNLPAIILGDVSP